MTDADDDPPPDPAGPPAPDASASAPDAPAPLPDAARGPLAPDAPAPPVPATDGGWRQLDVRVLAVHVARVAGSLTPIVLLLVLGGSLDRTVLIPVAFVFGGGALRAIGDAVTWATTRYRVGEELVELRSGLLRRRALSVPRDRVRTVNLTAKPLHRAFGIATVEIGTGTHEQGQLRLDAVAAGEGRRLRAELLRRGEPAAAAPGAAPGHAPAPADASAPGAASSHTVAPGDASVAGAASPRAVAPGDASAAGATSPAPAPATTAPQPADGVSLAGGEPPEVELARLRWRWLPYHLLSPWTLLLPVAAFGGLFNLLDQVGLEQRVSRIVGRAAEDGLHRADTEPWWAALLLVLLALVVLLLLGAVGASLQFTESWWRFRLTREPSGTLHLSRGLLTSRSVTIEQRRLRGVMLSEPPLQRIVGGAGLRAVVSGLRSGGDGRPTGGADTLLPNVARAEAEAIAAAVLLERAPAPEIASARPGAPSRAGFDVANDSARDAADVEPSRAGISLAGALTPHPRAALRRRLTRGGAAAAVPLVALLLLGPVTGWLPGWLWLLALPAAPLFLLAGRDAYRALGHRVAGDCLVTRHGLLGRHTTALRRDGVIGWNVRRSPFQRRVGLVTLTATTAAGRGGYEVVDVGEAKGLAFAEEALPGLLAPFLDRGDGDREGGDRSRGGDGEDACGSALVDRAV